VEANFYKGSWHVSQDKDYWYFEYLTSIEEDYAIRWRRFQKIQQQKTCTKHAQAQSEA